MVSEDEHQFLNQFLGAETRPNTQADLDVAALHSGWLEKNFIY